MAPEVFWFVGKHPEKKLLGRYRCKNRGNINLLKMCAHICKCTWKNIHSIYSGNKAVYFILKTCCIICFISHVKGKAAPEQAPRFLDIGTRRW
jgi:hypothetical protein